MIKEYNPDSKGEYTAPEASLIVEPEPMILNKWIKRLILYSAFLYLSFNSCSFLLVDYYRSVGMSKSEIEEKIDRVDRSKLEKFVIDDLTKPGRKLAYRIHGDGEQEK